MRTPEEVAREIECERSRDECIAEAIRARDAEVAEQAWDEGFKQGGPMHDVNYDDPDAHTRNPYRKGGSDAR